MSFCSSGWFFCRAVMRAGVLVGIFAAIAPANATPIHPDPKKVVEQARPAMDFAPARAGWNGPESMPTPEPNPTLERIGPAGSQKAAQESLKASALPDLRAVAGILLVILLLRRIRNDRKKLLTEAELPPAPDGEVPRAA